MTVKEMVRKAKKGDKEAYKNLVNHYEEYFCNKVIFYNDESYRTQAKEILPDLVVAALKLKRDDELSVYLNYMAQSYFRDKKRIGNNNNLTREKIIDIYAKRFYKIIEDIKDVLSEEQLWNYSKTYVTGLIDKYISDRITLADNITSRFAREKKYFENDECFYLRYTYLIGIDDNIVNYFTTKYEYLLDGYKTRNSYILLKENFENIVRETLMNISSSILCLEPRLKKELHSRSYEYGMNVSNSSLAKSESEERIYDINVSTKDFIFEKYKKEVDLEEKELKGLIEDLYDKFYVAYVNGKSNETIRKYMFTRFRDFFNNRKIPKSLDDEQIKQMELDKLENYKYVDKNSDKLNTNHPYRLLKVSLETSYDEFSNKYYIYGMKRDFKSYITTKLRAKVKELNELYSDDNIIKTSVDLKSAVIVNKGIDESIVEEIIDNLTEYYLSNKIENEKPFELFIIDFVENFDIENYLMIKDLREHINLKVLDNSRVKRRCNYGI